MRTHHSIEITKESGLLGKEVIVSGWINSIRDHGGVYFIDLRDSKGIIQLVANPKTLSKDEYEQFHSLRDEWVIEGIGIVDERGEGLSNKNLITGEIEITLSDVKILSKANTLPFQPGDKDVNDDLKLKYRYLELRSKEMQKTLKQRSDMGFDIRKQFHNLEYTEVETPILIKSSEGGAEEVYATSKLFPKDFYSLPQSPQMYKQLLMVGGVEKYFSFAKCFRAESARSDRNIEFTQIDMERSFSNREGIMKDVLEVFEASLDTAKIDKSIINHNSLETTKWLTSFDIKGKINIELGTVSMLELTYENALQNFGSDKPDLRFQMPLLESKKLFINTEFKIFSDIAKDDKNVIKAIVAKQADFPDKLSKRKIKDLEKFVNSYGAKGLAYFQCKEEDGKLKLKGPLDKFLTENDLNSIAKEFNLEIGDIVFFGAGEKNIVLDYMGRLRIKLAEDLNLIDNNLFIPLWITDFPLFEKGKDGVLKSVHHPFTQPEEITWNQYLNNEIQVEEILSDSYDLVLNGVELGGGSVRIHNEEVQNKIFDILNIDENEKMQKFGFFIEALKFGVPPHCGFAFGYDRLLSLLLQKNSIREVIAFPKNQSAICPMTDSPNILDNDKQKDLGLRFR
jgi:aspartyl-tRNA synthetase